MFRSMMLLSFVGFFGLAVTGCEALRNYPVDRARDLADIIGVKLYCGQGVLANGRVTKIAQVGAGAFDGDIVEYRRRGAGVVEEMRGEAGLPFYYFTSYDRAVRRGNDAYIERMEDPEHIASLGKAHYNLTDPHDRGFYEVGVDVAAFVGVGVSVDLFQVLDFAFGWFGFDIGRDDVRNQDRPDVDGPRFKGIEERPISGGTAG